MRTHKQRYSKALFLSYYYINICICTSVSYIVYHAHIYIYYYASSILVYSFHTYYVPYGVYTNSKLTTEQHVTFSRDKQNIPHVSVDRYTKKKNLNISRVYLFKYPSVYRST